MAICIATPDFHENEFALLAAAIALTTTAFGTLVPILHERGLVGTRIGKAIFAYGTWQIGPIIVIALILSTRKTWVILAILAAFALIAVAAALIPKRIWENGIHLPGFFERNRDTNAQITVRSVLVLLVGLLMVSALFDLDIVLGAFAAGFVLRFLLPGGDRRLEHKLNGIGYGFFIPLFFIVSGMAINPMAVAEYPLLLVLFIVALLAVRALPDIRRPCAFHPETRDMTAIVVRRLRSTARRPFPSSSPSRTSRPMRVQCPRILPRFSSPQEALPSSSCHCLPRLRSSTSRAQRQMSRERMPHLERTTYERRV